MGEEKWFIIKCIKNEQVEDMGRKRGRRIKKDKMEESELKKLNEWHKLVVNGLVNGLSHTYRDGRLEDINFWRKRSTLFNAFALCVQSLVTEQNYEYSEKELKEIAREGYKLK